MTKEELNRRLEESIAKSELFVKQVQTMIKAKDSSILIADMVTGSPKPNLIFELNTGVWQVVSQSFAEMLGYKPSELSGKSMADFVHPDDVEPTMAAVGYNAKGGAPQFFANRYRHKAGHYRWILWYPALPTRAKYNGVASAMPIDNPPEGIKAGFIKARVEEKVIFE